MKIIRCNVYLVSIHSRFSTTELLVLKVWYSPLLQLHHAEQDNAIRQKNITKNAKNFTFCLSFWLQNCWKCISEKYFENIFRSQFDWFRSKANGALQRTNRCVTLADAHICGSWIRQWNETFKLSVCKGSTYTSHRRNVSSNHRQRVYRTLGVIWWKFPIFTIANCTVSIPRCNKRDVWAAGKAYHFRLGQRARDWSPNTTSDASFSSGVSYLKRQTKKRLAGTLDIFSRKYTRIITSKPIYLKFLQTDGENYAQHCITHRPKIDLSTAIITFSWIRTSRSATHCMSATKFFSITEIFYDINLHIKKFYFKIYQVRVRAHNLRFEKEKTALTYCWLGHCITPRCSLPPPKVWNEHLL